MSGKKEMIGQIFGRWTVLKECEERAKDGRIKWWCRCSCDKHTERAISGTSLRQGTSQSCGCLQIERTKQANKGNTFGQKNAQDLTGQTKGHLTPILRLETKARNGSWEWLCQCDCGNECISNTTDLNAGRKTRCNKCSNNAIVSKGEEQIIQLLQNNKIEYVYQKVFDTCIFAITNKKLKFDFYIPNGNYLIEFDGEQHFRLSSSSHWKEKCSTLSERDNYKNQWCQDNNIPLIRIPYTQLNKIVLDDLLINKSSFRVV